MGIYCVVHTNVRLESMTITDSLIMEQHPKLKCIHCYVPEFRNHLYFIILCLKRVLRSRDMATYIAKLMFRPLARNPVCAFLVEQHPECPVACMLFSSAEKEKHVMDGAERMLRVEYVRDGVKWVIARGSPANSLVLLRNLHKMDDHTVQVALQTIGGYAY